MDVKINHLNKSYGDLTVLHDFTATMREGEVTCIMGHSGSGKTTLMRILMGLESADSGTLTGIEGKRLSAVFQEDRLCENLSPTANIRLVCPSLSKQSVQGEMALVGLIGDLAKPTRELSGGMKRRVTLLRALAADYEILFLDEPFKGLDVDTKLKTMNYTKDKVAGKTVILVTHDLTEAEAIGAANTITL